MGKIILNNISLVMSIVAIVYWIMADNAKFESEIGFAVSLTTIGLFSMAYTMIRFIDFVIDNWD